MNNAPAPSEQTGLRDAMRALAYLQVERRRRRTGETALKQPRDAVSIARYLGMQLDDWQVEALLSKKKRKILLAARQAGKTEVGTLFALDQAINNPGSLGLAVGPADRQAKWLLDRIRARYSQIPGMPPPIQESVTEWRLENGSRFVAMPGSEQTIRGLAAVNHLLIDEASRVPDKLYYAIMPMLATTNGSAMLMSTPAGKRGFFYDAWAHGDPETWLKIRRTAIDIVASGRIDQAFIDQARLDMGEWWFDQEYMVEFKDDASQLYATHLIEAAMREVEMLDLPWPGEEHNDAKAGPRGDDDFAALSDMWGAPDAGRDGVR